MHGHLHLGDGHEPRRDVGSTRRRPPFRSRPRHAGLTRTAGTTGSPRRWLLRDRRRLRDGQLLGRLVLRPGLRDRLRDGHLHRRRRQYARRHVLAPIRLDRPRRRRRGEPGSRRKRLVQPLALRHLLAVAGRRVRARDLQPCRHVRRPRLGHGVGVRNLHRPGREHERATCARPQVRLDAAAGDRRCRQRRRRQRVVQPRADDLVPAGARRPLRAGRVHGTDRVLRARRRRRLALGHVHRPRGQPERDCIADLQIRRDGARCDRVCESGSRRQRLVQPAADRFVRSRWH